MPESPVNAKTDLVTFTILAGGKQIDDTYEVMSIQTSKRLNHIAHASIILLDGSAAESDFKVSNKPDFLPGVEVEIKAGYHSKEATIFKGQIVKHGIAAGNSYSELRIDCSDKAVKMTVGRKNAYYQKKKDSDIISTLIKGAGATADVDATTYEHPTMIQYNATDWDFMLTRADANGLLVAVSDGKISVKKPDTSKSPALVVGYGDTILEFNAELDATDQFKSVKGYAWDGTKQEVVNGTGKSSVKNPGNVASTKLAEVLNISEYSLQSNGAIAANDLKAWSLAQDTRSKLSAVRGSVKFQGSSLAVLGEMLQMEGVGERFNGNVFITSVGHMIENGNWTTEVDFGLSPEWYYQDNPDLSSAPASGLLPAIQGLHTGIVKQIHEDPDGNFRVLTKIPILQQDKDAVWARLASYYASNGFGNFFYPEVNDEVILGFVNNDPRYPVILGSVYSKKNKPPLTPADKNEKKALVTQSKMEISFDDKDKIIQIQTPGGNILTISDKDKGITVADQNKNKLTLDSSGITLDSASDIVLKSKANITITAGANLEQTAKANVKVEGLQVEQTAKTSFTAKGNATAEVSASGQTTIKGAIVMIN